MNERKLRIVKKKFKSRPSVKKILGSIRTIKSGITATLRRNSVLSDQLDIQHSLLYLTLMKEAEKSGFKKGAKVIFKRDNSEHTLGDLSYLDRDSLELAVDLSPRPNVKYFNKNECPVRLSHIKLKDNGTPNRKTVKGRKDNSRTRGKGAKKPS
jgi:hypothetical protein